MHLFAAEVHSAHVAPVKTPTSVSLEVAPSHSKTGRQKIKLTMGNFIVDTDKEYCACTASYPEKAFRTDKQPACEWKKLALSARV